MTLTDLVSSSVEQRLQDYFDLLGTVLWDSRQRASFATYAVGLMSELERKSLEPIAASFTHDPREADCLHHRLQNFVADAPWSDDRVRLIAARYAVRAMTQRAPVQAWVCDDTSWLKTGDHSVGVQRQYCGSAGKVANCQVAPSLTLSTVRTHLPVDMTLYLGHKWADEPRRRAEAPDQVCFATKPQLMLQLLHRAVQNRLPPAWYWPTRLSATTSSFASACVRCICTTSWACT